ncbi:MAG: VWA domain-containing protein [Gemmataceae bacterium]
MSFFHVWMLWLLPLAVIPILLHLLTLHRLRTVELPTFRFLFDSYVQQRRRMRFLEALLAILRTLFLLFLIFLISRPVIKHWDQLFGASGGSGGREVVLLVDSSASMNAKTAGVSAMERARTACLSIVERLGSNDRVTLIRVTARPEELLSRFNTDTQGIRSRIEGLEASSSRANFFAAFLQLFGPEASRRTNPVVYVFTDSQAVSWKEARSQGLDRLLPPGLPLTVVHVGPTQAGDNLAVVGDAPRRNRAIAGLPFVLTPRIVNHGRAEASVTLSVLIDEKEVARTPLTLKPGESLVRSIVYTPAEPGLKKGRYEITARTGDVFPDDDRFLFTLSVQPRVKVVVVNGNPSDDPLVDEARYLATALTTRADPYSEEKKGEEKKPDVPTTREIQRSLEVVEVPQPGLTFDTLRDAGVVILANCGSLTDQQFTWLRGFVREGGGLLVFPGDKVSEEAYNTRFFPVPGPRGESLTQAKMKPPIGDPDKGDALAGIEFDLAHPALTVFNPREAFRTVRVYRRFGLDLPKERGNAWPIAYWEGTRQPALVESRLGDGVVIVAGFPAHPRWGNLPLKPDFVPLLLRLVAHAEHRPEAEVPPVVVADSAAEIGVQATWDPAEVLVKDPANRSTEVKMERSGARLLGVFEQTGRRGYYNVEARSGRADLLRAASLAFAVNLAPDESEFRQLNEAELRKLLPNNVEMTYIDASAESQALHGAIGREREVWPFLIWLLFAIIIVEFLLSTLSGHRLEGDEGPTLSERVVSVSTGAWVGRMTGGGSGG